MAAVDDLLATRFPALARGAGGYESYFQLGMRERDHGMEIQRYPDG